MSIHQSQLSIQQNEAYGRFIKGMGQIRSGLDMAVDGLRDMIAAGMDLTTVREEYGRDFIWRLELMATEKLPSEIGPKLLKAPHGVLKVLAGLPRLYQIEMVKDGMHIWRDGSAQVLPIEHVKDSEAAQVVDWTGDKPRIIPPAEQVVRRAPPRKKHDTYLSVEKIRLNPIQFERLKINAGRRGVTWQKAMADAVADAGLFD